MVVPLCASSELLGADRSNGKDETLGADRWNRGAIHGKNETSETAMRPKMSHENHRTAREVTSTPEKYWDESEVILCGKEKNISSSDSRREVRGKHPVVVSPDLFSAVSELRKESGRGSFRAMLPCRAQAAVPSPPSPPRWPSRTEPPRGRPLWEAPAPGGWAVRPSRGPPLCSHC